MSWFVEEYTSIRETLGEPRAVRWLREEIRAILEVFGPAPLDPGPKVPVVAEAFPFLQDTTDKDAFGRAAFSAALVRALLLPPGVSGFVVGLEGTWGSGKTFVVNQIKTGLRSSDPEAILLDFSPWMTSGADGVVEALLEQLGTAIGSQAGQARAKEAAAAGSSLMRYLTVFRHLKYLKYVPGVSTVGSIAEDLPDLAEKLGEHAEEAAEDYKSLAEQLPKISLAKRKSSVEAALEDLDTSIVVIVDDLDRLPGKEIRSVFQAVKAVANFPRVAYLLCYDPEVVSRALDRTNPELGRRYLEKIVQVQHPLPIPLAWRTKQFAEGLVSNTLVATSRTLTPDEKERWEETMSYFGRLCSSPRDVVRICNRLRLSLPATKHEVDACDVILFEALAITEPRVVEAIRQYPERFSGNVALPFESFDTLFYAQAAERKQERDGSSTSWKEETGIELSPFVRGALDFLFAEPVDRGSLRIRKWDRLYRLLSLGPAEFLAEIGDLKQLIANPIALTRALSTDDASSLSILRSVQEYRAQLPITAQDDFISTLAISATQRLNSGSPEWRELASQFSNVIEIELRRMPAEKRLDNLRGLISTAPLSISEDLVLAAAEDLGRSPTRPNRNSPPAQWLLDEAAYGVGLAQWLDQVGRTPSSLLVKEPHLFSVLYRWGQLSGSYALPRERAKELVRSHDLLEPLLEATRLAAGAPRLGALDIVWDHEELRSLLKSAGSHKAALDALERPEVRDYFQSRGDAPSP